MLFVLLLLVDKALLAENFELPFLLRLEFNNLQEAFHKAKYAYSF